MPGIITTTIYPWLVNVLQWPIIKSAMPSDKDPIGFGRIIGCVLIASSLPTTSANPTIELHDKLPTKDIDPTQKCRRICLAPS